MIKKVAFIITLFLGKMCGDSFSRMQALQQHETKHTSERPFLCESCGWSAKTKNALIIHTKKHTGKYSRQQCYVLITSLYILLSFRSHTLFIISLLLETLNLY